MATYLSYKDELRDKMPTFLLGPWGEKWVSVFGVLFDYLRDRAKEGVKARFPTECDDSLLPAIGWERTTERIPNESSDSYRERLHKAWITKRWSGTDIGILRGLETLGWAVNAWLVDILDWPTDWGAPNTAWFLAARDWGESTPDGDLPTPKWARFWIVLDWYSRYGLEPISAQDKAAIASVIRGQKASRCVARGVIFILSPGSWDDIRGKHATRGVSRIRGGSTEVVIP